MNTFVKSSLQWFTLMIVMTILTQCSQIEKSSALSEELMWLTDRNHFKDSTYESKFQEQVLLARSQNKWNDAAIAYVAKGEALDYVLQYDSLFLEECQKLYAEHHTSIRDSFRVQLPYYVGSQYDFGGQLKESDIWLKKAIANSKNPSFDRYAGNCYIILSGHKRYNQLDSAQLYAYKALEVSENLKDTINIGTIQYDFYRINSALGDDKAAINSLEKMVHYAKMTKDTLNLALAYLSFGFIENKNWTENKIHYPYTDTLNHIITKWKEPNEYYQFLNAFLQANKYIAQKNMTKAKEYLTYSESIVSPEARNEAKYLEDLQMRYDYATNKYISRQRYEQWLNRSVKQKDYSSVVSILDFLAQESKTKKNYKSAFDYLNKKYVYRDSLWNDEMKGRIIEFEKKYETVKKEQKIVEQNQALLERNIIIGTLGGLIGLLVLLSALFQNHRKRQVAEHEQQLQEQFSDALLQNVEDERSRIAGDLHDSINHNLLTLKQKSLKGQAVSGEELDNIIQQVRVISYNLYPSMFEEVGLPKSIEELCRKVMEISDIQVVPQIDYIKTLGVKQELQIYRIVEEALNNIIKHSEATHAMVRVKSNKSQLEVDIRDNGKGVDDDILSGDKITFGVANIKQRAKSIRGRINLFSDDKGTQLKLTVYT